MDHLVIKRLEETTFTLSEIVDLIHRAFEERLEQGIHFTCSDFTVEEYRNKIQNGIVLVAFDSDTNVLLGTTTFHIKQNAKNEIYGLNEFLAIHPQAKRKGVGSLLFQKELEILKNSHADYILSHTANKAHSSIAYHKKNGFRPIALRSFHGTDYYSYLFRYQITDRTVIHKAYHSKLFCFVRFMASSIQTRLIKKRDGSLTFLGRMLFTD